MRILVLCAILVIGCSDRKLAPAAPPSYRFLPASPEVVVRVDLVRSRAWPPFAKVTPVALAGVQRILDDTRRVCSLDVLAEASSVVLARRGELLAGDVTVIIAGLAKDKITSCFATIAKAGTALQLAIDGDLVHARVADKELASAAVLSTGELVIVSRGGQGVEPAAWKAEVNQGTTAPPAWSTDLDAKDPIAVRVVLGARTILASVQLADPLIVRGTVTTASEAAAKEDAIRMNAILSYLGQAKAGTGRIEPAGAVLHADFTATGAEIEAFVTTALPAVFGAGLPRDVATDAVAGPADCPTLAGAVASYLQTSLSKASASQRAELEAAMGTLLPALQKAYVESCQTDAWAAASIACHVSNSTGLARFEKCRETLSEVQREHLDTALKQALNVGTRTDTAAP
ncbi:MAG: hypothetical protein H6Q90_6696 [Deltaproteobacteria bacterium]|nr:hypothetical protein [Deltaproteobacteria bacterium]